MKTKAAPKAGLKAALTLTISTFILVACGGDGGGGGVGVGVATPPATGTNVWAEQVGTYSLCVVDRPDDLSISGSYGYTLVIEEGASDDVAKVKVTWKDYASDYSCTAATSEASATGTAIKLTQTKTIAAKPGYPVSGTAQAAQVTLESFTLIKGSVDGTIPALGTTTKVGYEINGNKVKFLVGARDADGLGKYFSSEQLTKQ